MEFVEPFKAHPEGEEETRYVGDVRGPVASMKEKYEELDVMDFTASYTRRLKPNSDERDERCCLGLELLTTAAM